MAWGFDRPTLKGRRLASSERNTRATQPCTVYSLCMALRRAARAESVCCPSALTVPVGRTALLRALCPSRRSPSLECGVFVLLPDAKRTGCAVRARSRAGRCRAARWGECLSRVRRACGAANPTHPDLPLVRTGFAGAFGLLPTGSLGTGRSVGNRVIRNIGYFGKEVKFILTLAASLILTQGCRSLDDVSVNLRPKHGYEVARVCRNDPRAPADTSRLFCAA